MQSILSCFSDDVAAVYDEAETLRGKKAIEDWIAKTLVPVVFVIASIVIFAHPRG